MARRWAPPPTQTGLDSPIPGWASGTPVAHPDRPVRPKPAHGSSGTPQSSAPPKDFTSSVSAGTPVGTITLHGAGFESKGVGSGHHPVTVLCGDAPPKITGGYAKWQTVDRPLMRGLTIFQGYDPTEMTLEIRFGRWYYDIGWDVSAADDPSGRNAGSDVEDDITWVSWMAGETNPVGPSPVVYVHAYRYPSGVSALIPHRFQGTGYPWVVTKLDWGQAWRNKDGNRTWQDATLTLTQYVTVGDNAKAPKDTTQQRGGYFTTTKRLNTAMKIASARSGKSPLPYRETLAKRIKDDPKNRHLHISGIHTPIKPGTKVWVPAHQI